MSDQPQQLYTPVSRGRSRARTRTPTSRSVSIASSVKRMRSMSSMGTRSRSRTRSKSKGRGNKTVKIDAEGAARSLQHPAMYDHQKTGFVQNWQLGWNQTDGVAGTIVGHQTTPTYRVRLGIFGALARKCYDYLGWRVRSWTESVAQTGAVPAPGATSLLNKATPTPGAWVKTDNTAPVYNMPSDKDFYAVSLYWRYGSGGVQASTQSPGSFKTCFVPYQGENFAGFAMKLMAMFYLNVATDKRSNDDPSITGPAAQAVLNRMLEPQLCIMRVWKRSNVADATSAVLNFKDFDLQDAVVTLDAHSVLKVQNRTKSSTSDQAADDIDLVPLIGKAYTGKGVGMFLTMVREKESSDPTNIDQYPGYVGTRNTGKIGVGFNATSDDYNDINNPEGYPAPKKNLKRVDEVKNVAFTPGEISNSVLKYTKTAKLNYFLRLIGDFTADEYLSGGVAGNTFYPCASSTLGQFTVVAPLDTQPSTDSPLGSYRTFWLQKQLNLPGQELSNISLSCEIDTRIGVSIKFKKQKYASIYQWRETQ